MMLEAKDVSFGYGQGTDILRRVNLKLESGQRLGLMADSGYGKTTLCRLLAGYEKPRRGEVLLDGIPLAAQERRSGGYCPVQLLWQHPEQAVNPRRTLETVIWEGDRVAPYILEGLGIQKQWLRRYPSELSGGEL